MALVKIAQDFLEHPTWKDTPMTFSPILWASSIKYSDVFSVEPNFLDNLKTHPPSSTFSLMIRAASG